MEIHTMSPFAIYYKWLWGNKDEEIPQELLSSSSPVSNKYIIGSFLMAGKMNYYLNKYFNNFGLWKLDRRELLLFIKKMVKDMKVQKSSIVYVSVKKESDMIETLNVKFPQLKSYEIEILEEKIKESEDKEAVYAALGLEKTERPKKEKTKKKRSAKIEESLTPQEFIERNFKVTQK
jgi:hypothetical protein